MPSRRERLNEGQKKISLGWGGRKRRITLRAPESYDSKKDRTRFKKKHSGSVKGMKKS